MNIIISKRYNMIEVIVICVLSRAIFDYGKYLFDDDWLLRVVEHRGLFVIAAIYAGLVLIALAAKPFLCPPDNDGDN